MAYDFDLFVIGGGSGGVRCARIAASYGAKVGIAESAYWGGTCVNVGCVPKKLMVMAADYGMAAEDSRGFGWDTQRGKHDWPGFIAAKDREIARLNGIYVKLLTAAGVELIEARATFLDAHTLDVGGRRVTAARIVIAVGGHPIRPDIPGGDLGIVSDEAFHLPALPKRVVMMGAGYISVEFAGIFAGLGAQVELVCRPPLPLRGFDHDIREALAEALRGQGVKLHCGTVPTSVERVGDAYAVNLADGTRSETDLVFWAIGRKANTRGLGLEAAGVRTNEDGSIIVDADQQTSQPCIYAIGDVSNTMNLTPVAIAEGHALADRLYGKQPRSWNFDAVPTAVFSHPPLATVGLTEEAAAARFPTDIYLTKFTPMRHTLTGRHARTVMKLVVEQSTQRVVGAHMLGDDAAEMMQGIAVAINAGATKQDFDRTVGIHPTAAEEWVTLRTRTRVAGVAEAAE
ncbi:MAG: glutathione-disulfide reductase [Acetobacteraceae bacterium]